MVFRSTGPVPVREKLRRGQMLEGLEEIINAELPISCERAFSLYAKAADFQRLGADIKDGGLQSGINRLAV
jgi:hypothetical protein